MKTRFKSSDFFLALAIFVLAFAVIAVAVRPSSFLPKGTEILEKRTWSSKTFSNGDGMFYTDFFNKRIHFFDGSQFIELGEFIVPEIKKENTVLEEMPSSLQCDFKQFPIGEFQLHKGISVEMKNNIINFTDAKNELIYQLTAPHSWDATQENKYENVYRMKQEGQNLNLGMDVSCEWLSNAAYPVIVDVDTNHVAGEADGYVKKGPSNSCAEAQVDPGVIDTDDYNLVGGIERKSNGKYLLWRGFVQFDTTTLTGATLNSAQVYYKVTEGREDGYGPKDLNLLGSSDGTACWGDSIDVNDWEQCINNEGRLFQVAITGSDPCTCSSTNCPDERNNDTCQLSTLSVSTAGLNTTGKTQYKIMHEDENKCTALAAGDLRTVLFDSKDDPDTNHFILQVSYTQPVPEFSLLTAFIAVIITLSVMLAVGIKREN